MKIKFVNDDDRNERSVLKLIILILAILYVVMFCCVSANNHTQTIDQSCSLQIPGLPQEMKFCQGWDDRGFYYYNKYYYIKIK